MPVKFNRLLPAAIIATALCLSSTTLFADNCMILTKPTSDPAPSVFTHNGVTKVYLYCTQDRQNGGSHYPIDTLHCYSSSDMYHWKDEGVALQEKDVPWAQQGGYRLWASHVACVKGVYRMYFPDSTKEGQMYIGVATSSTPTGPFIAAATPLSALGNFAIDPHVFIDDDSTVWISYRRGSSTALAQMNDSGTAITGSVKTVSTGSGSGYSEGPWIWKYNGKYYLMYAFEPNSEGNENISYSYASSLSGPWTFGGLLMEKNAGTWTIHSGVCFFKNKWYFFYHNNTFGGALFTSGQKRCSAIEYMSYNTDGTLVAPIPKTMRGVGIPSAEFDTIQVDRYSQISGAATTAITSPSSGSEKPGWYISGITNNSWVRYDSVDFTPIPGYTISNVVARVSSGNANGTIQVRLGSTTGTLLGTINVPSSGGLNTWTTTSAITLSANPPSGIQNLVLVFTGSNFQVNWVKFGPTPTVSIKSDHRLSRPSVLSIKKVSGTTIALNGITAIAGTTVRIYSINGKLAMCAVKSVSVTGNRGIIHLDSDHLTHGAYILSVSYRDQAYHAKLLY